MHRRYYRIGMSGIYLLMMLFPNSIYGQVRSEFSSTSVVEILRFLEKSHHDVTTFAQTKKILTVQYDTLVLRIDRIKQAGDIGFFDRIELKGLLKESEDIAKKMVKIDNLIRAHGEANEQQIAKLVKIMDKEISDTIRVLLSRTDDDDISYNEMSKLNRMFAEKAPFQTYRMKKFDMPLVDIRMLRNDEPEELYQKADYLLDQADRLSMYCSDLDRMILFIRAENDLKEIVTRFMRSRGSELSAGLEIRFNFPDSLAALQRLPLSKNLVMPFDDYGTLIQRLTDEREAAESRIRLFTEKSEEIRDIADYKQKIWEK
ncbi:hypothetical protein JNM05_02105 [bacterium]|nr:hypothetical protein [bacterium]